MPIEITMPRLSDTMEEGTLVKWRVAVGDKIASGDLLADIETDKATMELQSFDDGTVAKLSVEEGQSLPVGSLICVLAEEGEQVDAAANAAGGEQAAPAEPGEKKSKASEPADESSSAAQESQPPAQPASAGGSAPVSPLARKLADEHQVDLSSITGSGPGGRIIKRDVLAAAEGKAPAQSTGPQAASTPTAAPAATPAIKLESKTVKLTNMRKTIAKRLVESKTTIPHFTVTMTVNMDPLLALRTALNQQLESQGVKLSVNDFIVRAAALALAAHPNCNASWNDQGIDVHGTVSVGVAVALPEEKGGGLVVPVIRDTQNKGLRQISEETRALAKKAREAGLTLEEMSDGTFTISNLGMFGVDHFEAIINPPQAAILAVGAAIEKPVVRDGKIVAGNEMSCTLSCDHRVIDGAMAAEYLQTLKQYLEQPASLMSI